MNRQEVFDKVVTHLLTQKERSTIPGVGCAYRDTNGLSCAVGCLIKDEHYDASIEGHDTWHESVRDVLTRSGVELGVGKLSDMSRMLDILQDIHDNFDVHEWRGCLERYALRHHLTFNPPEATK